MTCYDILIINKDESNSTCDSVLSSDICHGRLWIQENRQPSEQRKFKIIVREVLFPTFERTQVRWLRPRLDQLRTRHNCNIIRLCRLELLLLGRKRSKQAPQSKNKNVGQCVYNFKASNINASRRNLRLLLHPSSVVLPLADAPRQL